MAWSLLLSLTQDAESLSLVVSLSQFLAFSTIGLFPRFVRVALFLLVSFRGLLLEGCLTRFVVVLLAGVGRLATLGGLISRRNDGLFIDRCQSQDVLFVNDQYSLDFFNS